MSAPAEDLRPSAWIEGKYRYSLVRHLTTTAKPYRGRILWIMLNPSTADHRLDDPTIRRVLDFSLRWHTDGRIDEVEVVNLFALRATDPADLWVHPDPVGAENDRAIVEAVDRSHVVVAAWGANAGTRHSARLRSAYVEELLKVSERTAVCLGKTKDGHPRHPLYVRADTKLETWP